MTKKIEATIRKEKLQAVTAALSDIGIVGLTVTEVRGRGRDGGMELQWRTGKYVVDLLPRMQVSIILSDDNVEKTINTLLEAAKTGLGDDGIIVVTPVEEIIRIGTGERGREAITYQGDIDTKK